MKTIYYYIIVIVAVICLACFVESVTDNGNRKEIISYCHSISNTVIEIDRCYFELGPFYYRGNHNNIYRVETDKHVIWFRKGLFCNDIEITN
jgi:hypothetical protein